MQYIMAIRQWLFLYVSGNGLILLANFPNGLLALDFFKAGKSSFRPSEESSFWKSDGGSYTFGFQAVSQAGGSRDYLLSIWLSSDPNKTAIWWPPVSSNDGNPTVKEAAIFQFTSEGSLHLSSNQESSPIWSSNTSSPYAKLQDTGNLMLFDSENSSASSWQSSEHNQADSILLVGLDSINEINKAFQIQSRKDQSSYVTGLFEVRIDIDKHPNLELYGKDYLRNDFMYADGEMNTTAGFQIGNDERTYSSNSSNGVERLTLDYDGNLKVYQWQAGSKSWVIKWQILDNKCRVGSPCGPFGICRVDADGKVHCSCPTGYKPKGAQDLSHGCESSFNFIDNENCNSTDITMEEVPDTDYYFNDINSEIEATKDNCKQRCLKRCECMASVFSQNGTCYVKGGTLGYLMNGYNSSGNILFIKVKIKSKQNWVNIGVGVAAAVLVVVGFGAWLIIWRRRNTANIAVMQLGRHKPKYEVAGDVGLVRFYRHHELVIATGNFREPLGKGGFGTVFKGLLAVKNTGFDSIGTEETLGSNVDDKNQQMHAVAVKVLRDFGGKRSDGDAHNESYSQFKAEINTLGKIHHVNLVSLLGYSYSTTGAHTESARMLVYECMEKGSLDKYLSTDQYTEMKLTWSTRYSIALGIARGMAYLHHDCSPPILHCDIKPHNILLDDNFVAKVADFGFARRIHPQSHIILSSVYGTHGYLAPEWLTSDEITFKVDVYSFGKLLLELVRGFKSADSLTMPVVKWAVKCMSQGAVMEFSRRPDAQADENFIEFAPLPHEENQQEAKEKLRLLKVGMWCIQPKPSLRPTMLSVVQLIEGTVALQDPPIPPNPLKLPMPSGNQSFSTSTYHYSASLSGR